MREHYHFHRKGNLATKINITFFVEYEVLNIFHLTIFLKKAFFKINGEKNFNTIFSRGKRDTKYNFEIFPSKKPIPAE